MSDVFISHAREDRAACERLGMALRDIGLDVTWDVSTGPNDKSGEDSDKKVDFAAATIVLWSGNSLTSDPVKTQAQRAFNSDSSEGSAHSNRYLGLFLGSSRLQDLPIPFNGVETDAWPDWFSAEHVSFADKQFQRLLSQLETMTGRKHLIGGAHAIAVLTERHRAELAAKDEALAQAQTETSRLKSKLDSQTDDLERHAAMFDERQKQIDTLQGDLATLRAEQSKLSAELALRAAALHEAERSAAEMHDTLNQAQATSASLEAAKDKLESELEDARAGLAAGLRRQSQLNVLLKATDDNLASAIMQREDLKAALSGEEQKTAKLTTQLSDAARKLAETEQTRLTYEKALIERKREIDRLEDKAAHLAVEVGQLTPRVEQLSRSAESWSNVPWRTIAAGSVAAGGIVTYGAVSAQRLLDAWLSPPPAITAAAPAAAPVQETLPPPAAESVSPKSDAKIEPDTIQPPFDEPSEPSTPEPVSAEPGAIPIPDESGSPISNDKVVFNPEGLPPVDPDSRPPPQDLPPMQQKPRLLLKPPPPSAEPAP